MAKKSCPFYIVNILWKLDFCDVCTYIDVDQIFAKSVFLHTGRENVT